MNKENFYVRAIALINLIIKNAQSCKALTKIKIEPIGQYDLLITIIRQNTEEKFRGNCTVWHKYPDGQRCSISTEIFLTDLAVKYQWENEAKK